MSIKNQVLSLKEQSQVIKKILEQRYLKVLPVAMREADIDMWIILCQEDDYDPVFKTMMPFNCWAPILQMLVFFDSGEGEIKKLNISMTDTQGLFETPWKGRNHWEQWDFLSEVIRQRDPKKIGLNIGKIQWAAGGLTHNLYQQFMNTIDEKYRERIVDAEKICTRWLMTYSELEKEVYQHVVKIAHQIIASCFSRVNITPGVTTTTDLEWTYWQMAADHTLDISFTPFFRIIRSNADQALYPTTDKIIRSGDLLHCDVGIKYLRLCSDHQELAYVLKPCEKDAPEGIKNLLAQNNRLQKVFLAEFKQGLTGNEMLANMLAEAQKQVIPNPKIYSHSLGLYLHEPGPLIGLPWEQKLNPGRGDVKLELNTGYTMELSIEDIVPEWDNQSIRAGTEQDVLFTETGCYPVDGVQTELHLI